MGYSDVSQAGAALSNPATTAEDLAVIVGQYPTLWPRVAAHPNVYDGLLDWLNQVGDDEVRAAVAARRMGPPPAPPAVPSQTVEPTENFTPGQTQASAPGQTQALVPGQTQVLTPGQGQSVTSSWATPTQPKPGPLGAALTSTNPSKPAKAPKTSKMPWKSKASTKSQQPDQPGLAGQVEQSHQLGQPQATGPTPPVQPTQSGWSAPPGQFSQSIHGGESPKKGRMGLIGLIVALCVVLLVGGATAGYFLWWKPKHEAEVALTEAQAQYTAAVESYDKEQAVLQDAIDEAKTTVGSMGSDDIKNPDLLPELNDDISAAEALIAPAPQMASETKAIVQQTDEITMATKKAEQAAQVLRDKVKEVENSQGEKAADILLPLIKAAQEAVAAAGSNAAVAKERKALQDAIDKAQTTVSMLMNDAGAFADVASVVKGQQTALSDAMSALDKAVANSCGGVDLPQGVTDLVCGGMPSGATVPRVTTSVGEEIQFSTPSGTIGCTANAYTFQVICEITKRDWTLPSEVLAGCLASGSPGPCKGNLAYPVIQAGRVSAYQPSDVPPWANNKSQYKVPTLAAGATANMAESIACYSARDSVTCWDVETHHGFKMGQDSFLHW